MSTQTDTNTSKHKHKRHHHSGIAFGFILILLGASLICATAGLLPNNLSKVIISWQMLLIVIGILSVVKRHVFSGLTLLLIGGFFIIPRLAEVFPSEFPTVNNQFISSYWAVLLVGFGILIVAYWLVAPHKKWHGNHYHCHNFEKRHFEINGGFSKAQVFSAGEYVVLEPEFKGGKVELVFGGAEIDLRKTTLPAGNTFLEIKGVFSGITLFVPEDWKVETQVECVFSGVSDKRRGVGTANADRTLVLTGSCVFSGCEIKN